MQPQFQMTALERVVGVFSPGRARTMALSRFGVQMAGQYAGARRDKTSLRKFNPLPGSADSDSLGDLPTLRARSRDLGRNAPIARGARNTAKTNVPGTGLRLSAELQREILGLTDDEAEACEASRVFRRLRTVRRSIRYEQDGKQIFA